MNGSASDSRFPWEGVAAQYLFDYNNASLSDSQRFTSVWIAFNAWMKGQFGTQKNDRVLIDKTKEERDDAYKEIVILENKIESMQKPGDEKGF